MILDQIFVSSPYTHPDPEVTALYVDAVTAFVHNRLLAGENVVSPIVYGHSIVVKHKLPGTYEFWAQFCLSFLRPCTKFYALCIPGWETSKGMADEIKHAQEWNIPVVYVTPVFSGTRQRVLLDIQFSAHAPA